MSLENLERLLEELRQVFRQEADDPGVSKIVQTIRGELPGIRSRFLWESTISRVLRHFREGRFALLSAFVPMPEVDERTEWRRNMERLWRLSREVRAAQLGYIPVLGIWKRIPERSLLVPNATLEQALQWGRRYGQKEIGWGERGRWCTYDVATGAVRECYTRFKVTGIDREFEAYSALKWGHVKPPKREPVKPGEPEPEEVPAYRKFVFLPGEAEALPGAYREWIEGEYAALRDGDLLWFEPGYGCLASFTIDPRDDILLVVEEEGRKRLVRPDGGEAVVSVGPEKMKRLYLLGRGMRHLAGYRLALEGAKSAEAALHLRRA